MTASDKITLAYALESVEITVGQASTILQWLGQQMAGTEAGDIVRDAGINLAAPAEPPVTTAKATSTTSTTASKSS